MSLAFHKKDENKRITKENKIKVYAMQQYLFFVPFFQLFL